MYLLYLDESGSNTSHFLVSGLAIPADSWPQKTQQIAPIKIKYDLHGKEIHSGWMLRRYLEQERIVDFKKMDYPTRQTAVLKERKKTLDKLAVLGDRKKVRYTKANYRKTHDFIHLTLSERHKCLQNLADLIGTWQDSRIFAEATYLKFYNLPTSVFENAFTNVVSRFDTFLKNFGKPFDHDLLGIIIQDNNESQAQRLTDLMNKFHEKGTMWTDQTKIIETPLFVDSKLTEMIQMVDLCAYATRRFFEKDETDLFDRIYGRFDRIPTGAVVGIRHYTGKYDCKCLVCREHGI